MARPSGRVSRREVEGGGRLQGAVAVPVAVNFANRSMHEGAMAARLAVYNHPTHSTSGTGPGRGVRWMIVDCQPRGHCTFVHRPVREVDRHWDRDGTLKATSTLDFAARHATRRSCH